MAAVLCSSQEELRSALLRYVLRSALPAATREGSSLAAASSQPSQAKAKAKVVPKAKSAPAPPSGQARYRVLCLHGYVQNAGIFRSKTGSVRKVLKGCDFEFVDAPLSAAGAFGANEAAAYDAATSTDDEVGPRGWWHAGENANKTNGETVRPAQTSTACGYLESMDFLRRVVQESGPFHGLLAFSQGCAMATALLREATEGSIPALADVKFAILIGGFLPKDPTVTQAMWGYKRELLSISSLHLSGTQDTLISTERSRELAALFDENSRIFLEHGGRHVVPTGSGAVRDALRQLLANADETQASK